MTYSLVFTDGRGGSTRTMPDLRQVAPVRIASMGAAITEACKLIRAGSIVWRINGAGGFMMERNDIDSEYWRRESISKAPLAAF